jgi:2-polyprenyl-6-methoxyphenol hydroxylase-like FAD-dependent oxidoreductase
MTSPCKIIVVGAGPAGLSLAHALTLAKIDFVVLERRDTVSMDSGASLVLAPTTLRVMEQFGLLDRLLALGGELKSNKTLDVKGNELGHSDAVQLMRKK